MSSRQIGTLSLTGGRPVQGGDETAHVAARLTWIFADQTSNASPEQRRSVRRWQGRDRFYKQVQLAALDDPSASIEAIDVADDLTTLGEPLTQMVKVWRGIRSVENTFGVGQNQLETLVGQTFEVDQFFSTTVDRRVAEGSRPWGWCK
ncbi:hypothetical protein [Mycolicibacter kumamotonensis]|jgi:hypothetical protein|uniref:Uncharacterized protein n=1 Tax=Mycolicibacter kumamotonensis TaxID=354243 RepID=A0A7K3LI60_9MYCO|nr:hypothetical protein [Mycolicibacter kumamotonensis]NDJ91982.1 hypothetical protein [Mycolicibacter kumamotonensis]